MIIYSIMGNDQSRPAVIKFEHADIYNNSGKKTVADLSIDIRQGDFVYITGAVGIGKTTVIKAIIGAARIQGGKASVFLTDRGRTREYNLRKLKERQIPSLRRKIGVAFQDLSLMTDKSIYENLWSAMRATGWRDRRKIKANILELRDSNFFNIDKDKKKDADKDFYRTRIDEYSGGQQKLVSIARALITEPDIIIMDEPTNSLAPEQIRTIMTRLRKENNDNRGTTVIIVTHDQSLPAEYPGRILECRQEDNDTAAVCSWKECPEQQEPSQACLQDEPAELIVE